MFRMLDGFFVAIRTHVFYNRNQTSVVLEVKPMRLDSLYWRIAGLEENEQKPLSFRAWAAYRCPGLPLAETTFSDDEPDAQALAETILEWADKTARRAVAELSNMSFADAVAKHPDQAERGAYAITLVTALIDERKWQEARQTARAFADESRISVHRHRHLGRDFHELALEWIDDNAEALG